MTSLLARLPAIVRAGRRDAARAVAHAPVLTTHELVLPPGAAENHCATANRLIHGDNLPVMASLLTNGGMAEKIDLIYIDPPFDSNSDYQAGTATDRRKGQFAYSDIWENGTAAYLAMLTPRLCLMHRLLSPTGSIYVHLDWHVGHYVKIILDEIFGRENFRNDIIWHYENKLGTGWSAKTFDARHDILLLYSKQAEFTHHPVCEPVRNRKPQPVTQKLAGRRVWLRNPDGTRQYRMGASERPVGDVWSIPIINPVAGERLAYQTQKPEALLERIITASSRAGALVADFFAGSGTAAAVAERLGRSWIAADRGTPAVRLIRRRLAGLPAKRPFHDQRLHQHPAERLRAALGRRPRAGELAGRVLDLFGATALPAPRNRGGMIGQAGGTLVVVDAPDRITGLATLRRAQRLYDRREGGCDKVVVLAWTVAPNLAEAVPAAGQDRHLQVLVIPPELLDRSSRRGRRLTPGQANFVSLRRLCLTAGRQRQADGREAVTIMLNSCTLLSPGTLEIDDTSQAGLLARMADDPLALIESWRVDPDDTGAVFRAAWLGFRTAPRPGGIATTARLPDLSPQAGVRQVRVRATDVLGVETEMLVPLPLSAER